MLQMANVVRFFQRPIEIPKWKWMWWLLGIGIVFGLLWDPFPGSQLFILGTLTIGGFVAWKMGRNRQNPFLLDIHARDAALAGPRERMPLFGPDMQLEMRPTITAHPVGLVLIIGLGLILLRLPGFFFFLVGAMLFGGLIGLLLWWKHR